MWDSGDLCGRAGRSRLSGGAIPTCWVEVGFWRVMICGSTCVSPWAGGARDCGDSRVNEF